MSRSSFRSSGSSGASVGSATPLINGTAAAGSATAASREDHVHPTDTTRLASTAALLEQYQLAMVGGNANALETMPRYVAQANMAAIGTGVMLSTAIYLPAGAVVSKILLISGGTAALTQTHAWHALYDTSATPALACYTDDLTTTTWGANTVQDLAITKNAAAGTIASYTVPSAGIYYVATMTAAATVQSLIGSNIPNVADTASLFTGQKVLTQTSGAALTYPPPSTIASATASRNAVYAIVH